MRVPTDACSQSSSLTNFTVNFMWNFYDCMKGKTAVATASATRPTKTKLFPPIKVLFPSLRTVIDSEKGPPVSRIRQRGIDTDNRSSGRGNHVLHGEPLDAGYERTFL